MTLMVMFFISFFYLFLDFFMFYFFSIFLFFYGFYLYGGFFDGFFFIDYFSLLLIFVSSWVFLFSILAMRMSSVSLLVFWVMFFFTFGSFFSSNYLVFYYCFEFVFLLMFFFLLGWGGSYERLQASFYMFFYTMLFSLPFLLMLLDCSYYFSNCFFSFYFYFYSDIFWFFMFLVFMVKLPILGFHLWLPKAHVEAPISGSMVLAGVLLKLGGYGVFRFFVLLGYLSLSNSFFLCMIFYFSILGGFISSILCVRQVDLKSMVAYSSIVHMSVMFVGFFSFSFLGCYGSFLMMCSHGFISPVLFFLMTFFYEYNYSRSLMVLKGAILSSPLLCFFWFLSCVLNLGVPPFMSFFSEISILGSLSCFCFYDYFILFFLLMFSGVYCIYMYTQMAHGFTISFFSLHVPFFHLILCMGLFSFVSLYPLVFFSFS